MIEVRYSTHLKFRLKYRNIPVDLPRKIYETAQEEYFDTDTNKHIAIKRVMYRDKMREMAVVFETIRTGVGLITIHPCVGSDTSWRLRPKNARIGSYFRKESS